jgi:AraC-like DNA-binding protein
MGRHLWCHRDRRCVEIGCRRASGDRFDPTVSNRPNRSSRRIAVPEHAFPCRFVCAECHGAMHEPTGASPIFLARPVKPAELVKCVRAILRKELGKHCLAADIARRLGMVRRSLERHLSAEGTTFRKIYRQVLLEASQRLLETDASVSDVAKALGFSELSASRFPALVGGDAELLEVAARTAESRAAAQGARTTANYPTGRSTPQTVAPTGQLI